jgi:hypothetical protein
MSDGYSYGDHEPTRPCPYCQTICRADFVDIGVGMTQCGPYHCDECGASEVGGYDDPRPLNSDEERTGWYAPNSQPGSSANVIGGRIVSHVQARAAYKREFFGNMLWHEKERVAAWWAAHRK